MGGEAWVEEVAALGWSGQTRRRLPTTQPRRPRRVVGASHRRTRLLPAPLLAATAPLPSSPAARALPAHGLSRITHSSRRCPPQALARRPRPRIAHPAQHEHARGGRHPLRRRRAGDECCLATCGPQGGSGQPARPSDVQNLRPPALPALHHRLRPHVLLHRACRATPVRRLTDAPQCLSTWFVNNRARKTCPDCRIIVKDPPAPAYVVSPPVAAPHIPLH